MTSFASFPRWLLSHDTEMGDPAVALRGEVQVTLGRGFARAACGPATTIAITATGRTALESTERIESSCRVDGSAAYSMRGRNARRADIRSALAADLLEGHPSRIPAEGDLELFAGHAGHAAGPVELRFDDPRRVAGLRDHDLLQLAVEQAGHVFADFRGAQLHG